MWTARFEWADDAVDVLRREAGVVNRADRRLAGE
jgi:hypothetical protein